MKRQPVHTLEPSATDGHITTTVGGKVVWAAPSGGGGGGSMAVEDEGTEVVATASRLNFAGAGVTVTDAGAGEATITIPGGGGDGGTRTEYDPTVSAPTSLVSWHRADVGVTLSGSSVTNWADKRGSGTAFTATAGATAPTVANAIVAGASAPVLSFDGAQRMLSTIVPATGAGARTMLAVVLVARLNPSGFAHFAHYGTAWSAGQTYGLASADGVFGNHYWGDRLSSMAPGLAVAPTVFAMRYNGTVDEAFYNGMRVGARTIALNTGSGEGITLASRVNGPAELKAFALGEIITWSRALTDAELRTAATSLLSWWAA